MPRTQRTPQEKKAASYAKDHRVRGGESTPAWRIAKPLKKRKAVRSARQKLRQAAAKVDGEEQPGLVAARRLTSVRQKEVEDWGVMSLREYVDRKRQRRRRIKPGH